MATPPTPQPPTPAFLDETLLAHAAVRLFGRLFVGLKIDTTGILSPSGTPENPGPDNPLTDQLKTDRDPRLARIYGFTYQGNYFKLAAPTVLLVHGPGVPVPPSINPVDLGRAGVEFKDETFSDNVLVWGCQDIDFSIRLDISSGWLTDILLAPEMSDLNNVTGGVAPDGSGTNSGIVGRSGGRPVIVGRSGWYSRPPRS